MLSVQEPADLIEPPQVYPAANTRGEISLRAGLVALATKPYGEASEAVLAMENDHAWRRETIWSKRGEARLAQALEHIAVIAGARALPANDAYPHRRLLRRGLEDR
jgi:hypothetical protein